MLRSGPTSCGKSKAEQFARFAVIIKSVNWVKVVGTYDHKQGDSGGNVNVFGGDNISYCEKKSSYKHMSNSEWLPDTAV